MLSGSRRIAVLLAAALLAGPARPALAQPASARNQKMASDLVKKAIARGEAGDHNGAIKLYNEAYRLAPNSLLLSNIGAQYQELGQFEDALDYFCRYLKEDPSGINSAFARSSAKRMQRELGRKNVDSRDPCATPPAERDETDDTQGTRRGSDDRVRSSGDRPRGDDKGKLADDPDRPADDRGRGTDRPRPEGKSPPIDEPAAKPARPANGSTVMMYSGLVAGIAGIAAGGLGVYYGVQGKNIGDQINSHPVHQQWPDNIRQLMSEGEHDNRLQLGYLVASGVLIATGVVLYVAGRPDAAPASEKTVRVAPTANGVTVFGRF